MGLIILAQFIGSDDSPTKTPQYLNDLDLLAAVKLAVYQRATTI